MESNESILHIISNSISKSKKLLIFSIITLTILTVVLYIIFYIFDEIHIEKFILIFGFCSTIYSVFITILLYQFISFSETEFYLDSSEYVEKNKDEIIERALNVFNFVKEVVQIIHSGTTLPEKLIPVEVRSDIQFLKSLNKSHVNEHTSLYKCKKNFAEFEHIITEINLKEITDICTLDKTKVDELWNISSRLLINLNTIFKRSE